MNLRFLALPVLTAVGLCSPSGFAASQLKTDPTASQVTFAVHATVDSFVGKVDTWTLELTMPAAGEIPDRVIFRTDLTALNTGKKARDKEMLAWMDAVQFPQLTFTLTSIQPVAAGGYEATGELNLHGKTVPLKIPITLGRAGPSLTIRGEVVVDHRKFDLKPIRKFAVLSVRPEVRVAFVIQGLLE